MNFKHLYRETSFHRSELTAYSGPDFVRAAYAAILKREPDASGFVWYVQALEKNSRSKEEILAGLRFSPEGKQTGVRIRGLAVPLVLSRTARIKVLGPVVQYAWSVLALPRLWREFYALESQVRHLPQAFEREIGGDFPEHVYWALEDQFRGSAREMETAMAEYIPLVQEVMQEGDFVLDLGCGRGEWLGLLRKKNIPGQGVDQSKAMVDACRMRGFEVERAHLLEFLPRVADRSIAVVTAFQVMEHLPPSVFVRVCEEIHRILKPGGMLLFETPNPENIQVGSYYFFHDPTHKKPIPPPVAAYTLQALGFDHIRIIRSKPVEPAVFGHNKLDEFFSAAMDYAAIGYTKGRAKKKRRESETSVRAADAPSVTAFRGLIIHGPYTGSYSLSLVNREMALALDQICPGHVGVCFENSPDWKSDEDHRYLHQHPQVHKLWEQQKQIPNPDIVLYNSYPPVVDKVPGAWNLTNAYGWEESLFPQEYVQGFNQQLDGLTLMSTYVQKTMQDNGVGLPMQVVGLGVDHIQHLEHEPYTHYLGKGFRFVHVSSCFPRKGLDVLLQAYGQAFSARDDVSLVVKTFPNPHNTASAQVRDFLQDPDAPEVVLVNQDISHAQVLDIYRQCHCLVAPSRGEGFGLPMAEAMLLGLPVITTAYGGQSDFCTPQNTWLIDYTFAQAESHLSSFGSVWVEPDAGHLARLMREVFHADHRELRAKTDAAMEWANSRLTWQAAAKHLLAFVSRLPQVQKMPSPEVGWVSSWNCRCGIAEYSKYLLDHLGQELEVSVLAPKSNERLERDGSRVQRLWTGKDIRETVPAAVCDAGFDCLVVNFHPAFYPLSDLLTLVDAVLDQEVRVIVIFHALPRIEEQVSELTTTLSRAHRLLVHSIHDLNQMKDIGLVRNVSLFPHGVTVASAGMDHLSVELPPGFLKRRIIASSGFLMPHKGIQELIYAFAQLPGAKNELGLLLVNALYPRESDISYYNECEKIIEELGLQQSVHMVPDFLPLEESLALLQHAELIVYPYQNTTESSSAAVRMGLAADRPVACTPLRIFDDVAEAVHFLPGPSPQELARGLNKLLTDHSLLQAQDFARREWISLYAWSNVASRMAGLIRALNSRHEL